MKIFIVFSLLFFKLLFANDFEVLDNNLYFQDNTNKIDFQEIQKIKFNKQDNNNFGLGDFTLWKKVTLKNNSDKQINIYALNYRTQLDYVDIFILRKNKKIQSHLLGDRRYSSNKQQYTRLISFGIELLPKESVQIYIKHQNLKGITEANWKFLNQYQFEKHLVLDSVFFGMNFGLIILVSFVSFMFYFSTKHKYALYYAFAAISILIAQSMFYGVLHQLDLGIPFTILSYPEFFYYISLFLSILFHYEFFEIKYYGKKMQQYFYLLSSIVLVLIFIDLIINQKDFGTFLKVSTLFQWFVSLSLIIIGIKLSLKGTPGGWYYVIAQSTLFVSTLFIIFYLLYTKHPAPIWSYYINIAGTFSNTIFLSLALFIRLKEHHIKSLKKSHAIMELSKFHNSEMVINNIIHQWKAPLTRIISIITDLQAMIYFKKPIEKSLIEYLPEINKNAMMLSDIVHEFYSFNQKINKSQFFFNEVYSDITDMLKDKIEEVKPQIDYELISSDDIIYSDKFILSNISTILINNFLDISKERKIKNPHLHILFKNENNKYTLIFKDNCGGIDVKPLEKIFEPFESNDENPKKGIGLYIAKIIIQDKLEGNISVHNHENGAIFEINFKKI